ncbi:hypothetical protein HZS_4006 [Henneguya salminicola]|nr:hypothetical protein HZS_4006 [Henneguya salminicola]
MENFKRHWGVCGDGVVDENEQCDCGFEELCSEITQQDKCCNMNTCRFKKAEYVCSMGECCKNCKFLSGNLCRDNHGDCDITECPDDVVRKNYDLCNEGQNFCYDGICMNLDALCKYIYSNGINQFFFKNRLYIFFSKFIINILNFVRHDICSYFICADKTGRIPHTIPFLSNNEYCLIPKKYIRLDALKTASNYMVCSKNKKNFCNNGVCTSSMKAMKNCKNSVCTEINNDKKINITKTVYHRANKYFYKIFTYSKLSKTSSEISRCDIKLLVGINITAIVILLLSTYTIIRIILKVKKKFQTEAKLEIH